jgi:hypothetical protein
MCLLKLDLPKKLKEAKNADVDTNRRWDTFRQWMDTKFSFNCVKRLTPKGKQLASRDKEPTTENNRIMLTPAIYHQNKEPPPQRHHQKITPIPQR